MLSKISYTFFLGHQHQILTILSTGKRVETDVRRYIIGVKVTLWLKEVTVKLFERVEDYILKIVFGLRSLLD